MKLIELFVRQPVLVNLMVILILVSGVFSYRNMAQDQFPDVSVDIVMVTTIMQGAAPQEVEQLITTPLEEEIAKLDGIDSMTSVSSDGSSLIAIELEAGVDSIFEKVTEVQNQIEKVQNFPQEAETPVVTEIKVRFDTVTVALIGHAPESEVKKFAELLDDELNNVQGVEEVVIAGLREREIWVEVDPPRLHSYGLGLADVSQALRARNLNLPGGLIRMGRGEFVVRTEAEFRNVEEILETVIFRDPNGGYVYLRDVAKVRDTFEDPVSLARLDGADAVLLTVKKSKESNAIEVVDRVRAVVESYQDRLPAGLDMRIVADSSIEIRERLASLYSNFAFGLVLVVCSFAFSIGMRAAFVVVLGLPVAILGTFILLNAYGYTVNTLVLFSMILVLGLIVDDAIVVCENVYRLIEEGVHFREAAIRGTTEIMWPVIATVLTTVAAFLPLLLMGGVLGKFMSIIPIVVSLALMASLIEALFILPSHIAEWGSPPTAEGRTHAPRPWMAAMSRRYEQIIEHLLRLRYLMVAGTIGLAVVAGWVATQHMDFILFGGRDLQRFSLVIEAPASASLAETTRILSELEERALRVAETAPEVRHVRMRSGMTEQGVQGLVTASNVGEVEIELVPLSERVRMGHEIKNAYRELVVDVAGARTLSFEDRRDGPPVGKAVQIRIRGDNFDTLKKIADEIKAYLATLDGVSEIMDNFPPGKDEVRPELDLERVALAGLDVRTVAAEIRGAFDGIESTTVHDGDEEVEVIVKYNEAYRSSLSDVSEMQFATRDGMVPFRNIGQIERTRGVSAISHFNQKRTINVLADVVEGKMTSKEANEAVMAKFEDIPIRYPGYSLDYGGEFEDIQESLSAMVRAFTVTLILIYVILGGLFASFLQPLIVMFAVPFSFIGAILGLYLINEPLGMFAIIGIIALAGIVVNDSLILIDFINTRRREGVGLRHSIIHAGAARLRPILLTSITTIAGLFPMAYGIFGGDPLLRPMALSIVWGLTFSTVLTLIIIPCVYAIGDDYSKLILRHPLGLTRAEWRERRERGEKG